MCPNTPADSLSPNPHPPQHIPRQFQPQQRPIQFHHPLFEGDRHWQQLTPSVCNPRHHHPTAIGTYVVQRSLGYTVLSSADMRTDPFPPRAYPDNAGHVPCAPNIRLLEAALSAMERVAMGLSELALGWRACGLQEGDTVLLHSDSVRRILLQRRAGQPSSPADLLSSFLEALGPAGTLLMPLFNFEFTQGRPFDIRSTPSHMGAITEAARIHPEAVRTGHPIYSFAVIGAQAARFEGLDNFSGYGADSPFGILREMNGRIAALDISDQRCMTFHHHVEEMCGVPYRFHKIFEGLYTDAFGRTDMRRYGIFVRDLAAKIQTCVEPMETHLWAKGLWRGSKPGQGFGLRVVGARALFTEVENVIHEGKAEGMLYRVGVEN